MLSACKAIVVGKTTAQEKFLTGLARKCGFTLIEGTATADIPTARNLTAFFLVDHRVGDDLLGRVTEGVRAGNREVRFSPVIVIADDCPFERILRYVHMGVDDVISLPEKREVLTQRFSRQLFTPFIYIETPNYFGPDRRRLETESANDQRVGLAGHARFEFQRLPDAGVRILSHQIFPARRFTPKLHLGN